MDLTFEEIKQELSLAKSVYDLTDDIALYNENCEALRSQDFYKIREQLDISLRKYGGAINMLSIFTDVTLVQYPVLTYEVAFSSLAYITNNIPFYVAFDKLKEKGMELILNKLLQGK